MVVCQLNNLELAVNLAKRGNLPGAENLVGVFMFCFLNDKFLFVSCAKII